MPLTVTLPPATEVTVWLRGEFDGPFLILKGPLPVHGRPTLTRPASVRLMEWHAGAKGNRRQSTMLLDWEPPADGAALVAHVVRYAADPRPLLDWLVENAPPALRDAVAAALRPENL